MPEVQTFNSRPHKEVDFNERGLADSIFELSIHDLTRRSTGPGTGRRVCDYLSIHDLTRRSTILLFNLRHSRGLSIHDLTRRSTIYPGQSIKVIGFQFTTSQGGRRPGWTARSSGDSFNSRPHKEVDSSNTVSSPRHPDLTIHDLTRSSKRLPPFKE